MFLICLRGLTCLRSTLVLSKEESTDASPVHTIKDARNKDHTTAPPNTGIYSINESTNKCTSGVKGRPKSNVLVYNLYCFPTKNGGGNTEKCYTI